MVFFRLLELFDSSDIEEGDAEMILPEVLNEIKTMASAGYPLLLTHGRGKRAHLARAEEAADSVISIDAAGSVLKTRVEKDPTMETTSIEFFNADGAEHAGELRDFMR